MKQKIIKDWFYLMIGILWMIFGFFEFFYIKKGDWFITIFGILMGILFIFNSFSGKTLGDYLWRRNHK